MCGVRACLHVSACVFVGGEDQDPNSFLNPELTNTECSWLATLLPGALGSRAGYHIHLALTWVLGPELWSSRLYAKCGSTEPSPLHPPKDEVSEKQQARPSCRELVPASTSEWKGQMPDSYF